MILPKRKNLPFLGNLVKEVTTLDTFDDAKCTEFENNARYIKNEREAAVIGDIYSRLQPTYMPNTNTYLIGKKLDTCELYELEECGSELQWSQWEVSTVSDGSNIIKPGVRTAY